MKYKKLVYMSTMSILRDCFSLKVLVHFKTKTVCQLQTLSLETLEICRPVRADRPLNITVVTGYLTVHIGLL